MGGMTVVRAVEPGTAVKTGDVLLTLDREKIDRAIRDLEADQQLADLAIRTGRGGLADRGAVGARSTKPPSSRPRTGRTKTCASS